MNGWWVRRVTARPPVEKCNKGRRKPLWAFTKKGKSHHSNFSPRKSHSSYLLQKGVIPAVCFCVLPIWKCVYSLKLQKRYLGATLKSVQDCLDCPAQQMVFLLILNCNSPAILFTCFMYYIHNTVEVFCLRPKSSLLSSSPNRLFPSCRAHLSIVQLNTFLLNHFLSFFAGQLTLIVSVRLANCLFPSSQAYTCTAIPFDVELRLGLFCNAAHNCLSQARQWCLFVCLIHPELTCTAIPLDVELCLELFCHAAQNCLCQAHQWCVSCPTLNPFVSSACFASKQYRRSSSSLTSIQHHHQN